MDYYLLDGTTVLVEEFARDRDHVTVGLRAAAWDRGSRRWVSCAAFSRALRGDPGLLARVTPVDRARAEAAHGGPLPPEAELRAAFLDFAAAARSAPLRLGQDAPPEGFQEQRFYRVLFAKDAAAPYRGDRRAGADVFSWELRRVAGGTAWALDLTALLADGDDTTVGTVLTDLTREARTHGLIPIATERFS
ncbi:hypothetical protein [Catenuloplanes japonicus]|uniref:hypothetical protein n=1 Tax=Catenuloplanes japonicus TaxID=33876 RepID=UPI00068BB068|nr:hypothetical protein [Catenuloplanes japonicus]